MEFNPTPLLPVPTQGAEERAAGKGGAPMQEGPLMVKADGHTATITVNRPERRNALTPELLLSLGGVLSDLVQDRQVRVVVLRGAGEEAFSAGYDITRIPTGQEVSTEQLAVGETPLEVATASLEECPLPGSGNTSRAANNRGPAFWSYSVAAGWRSMGRVGMVAAGVSAPCQGVPSQRRRK